MERIIFSLLVFLAPSQLALHFWPNFAHVFGIRVDYLAPTIYLTDILVGLLLVNWLVRYRHKILMNSWVVALVVLAFLNITGAKSIEPAIYKWGKIFELLFLGFYVATSRKFEMKSWLVKPLAYSITLFSLVGITQILIGKTIGGPLYLLGERTFSIATPGIALVTIAGREFLRAYSTFPHPNSMAGYMLVAGVLILFYERSNRLKLISTAAAALSVLFSFSLAAYIAGAGALVFSRIKINTYLFVFILVALSMLAPLFTSYFLKDTQFSESVEKRIMLMESAERVFSKSPIFGVGLNNFLVVSKSLQPAHNIFLLVLSESGIVGLLFFLYLIIKALDHLLETGNWKLIIPVLIILMTGLADHYWLTLQQNQLLLSLLFGLSLRRNRLLFRRKWMKN